MTVVSSREFNQNLAGAKRAAREHPVTITDRGRPDLVLMSHEEYLRLAGTALNLRAALVAADDVEFDPAVIRAELPEVRF